MEVASSINSEKRALWRQDNIKNNSLQSHRCLGMLNKRRERQDGQDQEERCDSEQYRERRGISFA
jgi:hypothetical protein